MTNVPTDADFFMALKAILFSDLRQTEKLTALAILSHADRTLGNSFPGNQILMQCASVKREQTITDALHRLKEKGLLERHRADDQRYAYRRIFGFAADTVCEWYTEHYLPGTKRFSGYPAPRPDPET